MPNAIADKIIARVKARFTGFAVDKVVLPGIDKLMDAAIDTGIEALEELKRSKHDGKSKLQDESQAEESGQQ
jgi:hypothetical protein